MVSIDPLAIVYKPLVSANIQISRNIVTSTTGSSRTLITMESKAGDILIEMLGDWLINHIVEHDMKVRDYLQSGLQPSQRMPPPS